MMMYADTVFLCTIIQQASVLAVRSLFNYCVIFSCFQLYMFFLNFHFTVLY